MSQLLILKKYTLVLEDKRQVSVIASTVTEACMIAIYLYKTPVMYHKDIVPLKVYDVEFESGNGVDILAENMTDARERLEEAFNTDYVIAVREYCIDNNNKGDDYSECT